MLDFDKLQEFPKKSSWTTLLKCTLDQQFMEHLKLCHMDHHRNGWRSLYSFYIAAILKSKMVTATSKYCFDITIIFLGHNNEGIPAKTIYLSCSVWKILINVHSRWQPYWITIWPPLKVLINPSFTPQPKTLS